MDFEKLFELRLSVAKRIFSLTDKWRGYMTGGIEPPRIIKEVKATNEIDSSLIDICYTYQLHAGYDGEYHDTRAGKEFHALYTITEKDCLDGSIYSCIYDGDAPSPYFDEFEIKPLRESVIENLKSLGITDNETVWQNTFGYEEEKYNKAIEAKIKENNEKRIKAASALNALSKAFMDCAVAFDEMDEEELNACITEDYPFEREFGELSTNVTIWAHDSKLRLVS